MMVSKTWKNYNKYFCQNCKDRNWVVQCECGKCDIVFTRIKNRHNIIRKFVKGHNHLIGDRHHNWRDGRILDTRGYILIRFPNHPMANKHGYVKEHRYLYEQYFNCCLLPWTDVHHKNGDKTDNRKENLMALIHGEHSRHTRLKHYRHSEFGY